MPEHPLAEAVARESPGQEDRVGWAAAAGARIDARVRPALAEADPTVAGPALAAALRALYQDVLPFRGTPGAEEWLVLTHRQLYRRARELFQAEAGRWVQAPVDALDLPAGRPGELFPRG